MTAVEKETALPLMQDDLTPEGVKIYRQLQREILEIYRRDLRTLQELGYIQSKNISVLAFNILGILNCRTKWFTPEGPLSL